MELSRLGISEELMADLLVADQDTGTTEGVQNVHQYEAYRISTHIIHILKNFFFWGGGELNYYQFGSVWSDIFIFE